MVMVMMVVTVMVNMEEVQCDDSSGGGAGGEELARQPVLTYLCHNYHLTPHTTQTTGQTADTQLHFSQ